MIDNPRLTNRLWIVKDSNYNKYLWKLLFFGYWKNKIFGKMQQQQQQQQNVEQQQRQGQRQPRPVVLDTKLERTLEMLKRAVRNYPNGTPNEITTS